MLGSQKVQLIQTSTEINSICPLLGFTSHHIFPSALRAATAIYVSPELLLWNVLDVLGPCTKKLQLEVAPDPMTQCLFQCVSFFSYHGFQWFPMVSNGFQLFPTSRSHFSRAPSMGSTIEDAAPRKPGSLSPAFTSHCQDDLSSGLKRQISE